MDYFEQLLNNLHSHVNAPAKAKATIKRLSHYFMERKSGPSTDLLLFLALGENGITSYIQKVLTFEASRHNVLHIFELLEFILVNFEKQCVLHVQEIMKLCLSCAQMNVNAKIRENSLKLLHCMFKPAYLAALDLPPMMSMISDLMGSDPPPSVLLQLFSVLGIVLEKAPEVTHRYKDELLSFFVEKIKEVERSKKNMNLLSGCLDGICGYLVNFTTEEETISYIYYILKKYCRVKEVQRRLINNRAALNMVIRHYCVFAKYIFVDVNFWRLALNVFLKKTGQDRRLGYRGLVSVFRAVTHVTDINDSDAIEKLNNIAKELLEHKFDIPVMVGLVELISTGHVRQDLARRALQTIMEHNQGKGSIYLPTNLECLSKYLARPGTIMGDYLTFVRNTAVILIGDYPNVDSNFRLPALQALEKSFYYLSICGREVLEEYAKEVIYQGLIISCSHQIYQDVELQKDITGKEMVSYKSYLPLWLHLTNMSSSSTVIESFEGKSMVSMKIFDEYMLSVLRIIKKLDLSFRITNPHITDLEMAAEANRPNDFKIFINLVNLFVDVIEGIEDVLIVKKWLASLFTEMIDYSNKSPFISGFYKILAVCLKVADKLDFFGCYENKLQKFLRDISTKVGRFKGDLQISCFQALLAARATLIEPFVKDLIPVFKVIVQVGAGNFPLLADCLTALEKWNDSLPKDIMEYILRNVLPCFDIFLQTKGRLLDELLEFKLILKFRGRIRKLASKETESQLLIFQRRFLLFLGRLDQDLLKQLIQPVDEEENHDYGKELIYPLPLKDLKLRIKVKELLQRVIELSLSSSDRRIRVAACESLHSMVLLTLGNMKQLSGELNDVFERLISVCLVLACDLDHIVFQIFEPLIIQMVHYFSDRERNLTETRIFISCLMETACHPHNSSLRNLAARLIREFVDWSLKRREVGSPDIINVILQKMFSFCLHPDHNKRYGAAIIFNNIHPIIRDQTQLMESNWFLLYYHFIECLDLCSLYDDTTQITTAVNFIKASLTTEQLNTLPKLPAGFHNDISCPIKWIFSRCSHPQRKIRSISMDMIEKMSKNTSVKQYVQEYFEKKCMKPCNDDDHSRLIYITALFHYYSWLLHHDVAKESHISAMFTQHKIGALLNKMPGLSGSIRASAIMQMLEFVTICTKKSITLLYKNNILHIIKDCLYSPSNFELEDRERLHTALENLFSALGPLLNNEEIKIFSSIDHSIFSSLGQCLRTKESLKQQRELLNGLKIIHDLNFWDLWKFSNAIQGEKLLELAFESLFSDRLGQCFAVAIDPNEKDFLCDFIRFSLKICESPMSLLEILTKGDGVTEEDTFQQNTKGDYFMQLFKPQLIDYFIETYEASLEIMIRCYPTKVLVTVNEAVKYACRSRIDSETERKFVCSLYQNWSDLERMPGEDKRIFLLSIVRGMCELNPNKLVRENAVVDWVFTVMNDKNLPEEMEILVDIFPYLSEKNEELNERLTLSFDLLFKNLEVKNEFDPALAVLYKGLIKSFVRTKSVPVLREISRISALYNNLLKRSEIKDMFCDSSPEQIKRLAYFLYQELFDSGNVICETFLKKLLMECDSGVAQEFLLDKFGDLLLRVKAVGDRFRALGIIQICILRFPKEKFEALPAEKKNFFRSLMMVCVKTLSGSSENRSFACACFNILCTVIVTKTNDPRQYRSLIFKEDFPFLSKLVDRQRVWSLGMDFDELPKIRKVLTCLRRNITRERQMQLGQPLNSVKYLHEETLFNSSLREDVTQFDYTYMTARPMKIEEEFGVELEMDTLNSHECMPTLVSVIEHMVKEKVTEADDPDKPFWLTSLMRRLKSLNSHENEKIFLLKLMCNLDKYLKQYADEIAPILLDTLLEIFQEKPINYLVIDVITMVLNWKPDYVGLEATATRLAIYIIRKSSSYRKDIIKSNLDLAKLVIESFRSTLNVRLLSTSSFEDLKHNRSDLNAKYINLQFCGILLANKIPPWTGGSEEEFLKVVLGYCSGKTGTLAAEVAGLTLQYLEKQGYKALDKLIEMTQAKIRFIFSSNEGMGVSVLYAVYKTYPKISSVFLNVLQNSVWVLSGTFKTQIMEILLSHVQSMQRLGSDTFSSVIDSFLADMMTPDDLDILKLALKMVEVVLEKCLCDAKMRPVVEKALAFSNCRNLDIRKSICELAKHAYHKWDDEALLRRCKTVLLDGVNDSDLDLSEKCLKFWHDRTRAATSAEQFSKVLCECYHSEAENGFLGTASRLMSYFPATSSEFIFDYPLAPNCSFQKMSILRTVQRSTLTPMFAQSLSSQLHQPRVLQSLQSLASNPTQSILHSLIFNETAEQEGFPVETTTPKRKRFLKDTTKTKAYFAKKQIMKKEAELEEEREMTRKFECNVDILKEYSSGDIPDIRITHSQFLKPLEALIVKDPQIARHFLTAFYDSFSEALTESVAKPFYAKISELFHTVVLVKSPNPTVVAFLFHVLLHCDGHLQVEAHCVAKLAKSSGWLSVGGLLLEEMIIRTEGDDESQPRRVTSPEEKRWLYLAEIYRHLNEFEVFRGIFLDKLRVVDEAAEAIYCESFSDWQKAALYYQYVIEQPEHASKITFYNEAYLRCLARLSDWTGVSTTLREKHKVEEFWINNMYYESYLPWLMKAEGIISLQSGDTEALLKLVRFDEHCELKKLFPEELAIANFVDNKLQWVKYYVYQMYLKFLATWCYWNKWSNNLRSTKLLELQLIAELDQCTEVLSSGTEEAVNRLLQAWSTSTPSPSDDLLYWDIKVHVRTRFLILLQTKYPELNINDLQKANVLTEFEVMRCGISQRNLLLCTEYFERIASKISVDYEVQVLNTFYRSSLDIMREEMATDVDVRVRNLSEVCCQLERYLTAKMEVEGNGKSSFESYMLLNRALESILLEYDLVSRESVQYVENQLGGPVVEKQLQYLERATHTTVERELSEAYLGLAKYHRKQRNNKLLAKCILRAMQLGNAEARHLFCCLLGEPESAGQWVTDDDIKESCNAVPVWMFLKWTNQILANMDCAMFPFVKDILFRLAEEYPNAVRFAFRLSKNSYKYSHMHGHQCRLLVHRLDMQLLDAVHENFLTALSYVAPPSLVLLHDLQKLIIELSRPATNWTSMIEDLKEICERIFGEKNTFRGSAYDRLLVVKPALDSLLLEEHDTSVWKQKICAIMKSLQRDGNPNNLKEYSPYLMRLQSSSIELPGQYSGDHKPIVRNHVTIASFKYNVLVMNSKCQPIRVTIIGNDANDYKFLIKFGEDLRQDQRIQQAFGHMNHALRINQDSSRLFINTYGVIPLKNNLGMIEWVSKTASLFQLLSRNTVVRELMEKVQQEHLEFLAQDKNVTKPVRAHVNGYLKIECERAVSRFRERVNCFEWDLLRKAFWGLSSYPEQFVYLRHNFAVSQAVIYVAHWLLGIGDRHLDNTLVSSTTGRAIGIDFGCAFGFATEFLTPPELIPFRLTPQIVNLMQPMGESGLIKETMIQCLRALRRDPDALIATLQVFALEPALDWLEKARRDRTMYNPELEKWSPERKVAMVREKLRGSNPVNMFVDDLISGHTNSDCLEKYLEVLQGVVNIPKVQPLSEKDQVQCLINMATDYHVLSKTYVGWNPWL